MSDYIGNTHAKESPKYPVCSTSTSSPGSARLAATRSHPRVPDPDITNGCASMSVDWKSFLSIVKVSPKVATKGAPTWLSLCKYDC